MSAKAGSGISVMRADLDASTSTEVDAHEAQWRAGVNRQARPDAASQRRAASLAAAAKRRRIRTSTTYLRNLSSPGRPQAMPSTHGTAAHACSLSQLGSTLVHLRPPHHLLSG